MLSNINLWTQYYIGIFGNTLNLLDVQQIFDISNSLISNFSHVCKSGLDTHIYAMTTLLSAAHRLLFLDPNLANQLLDQIDKVKISPFDYYSSFQKKFLHYLVDYKLKGKVSDLETAEQLIDIADFIGQTQTANEFRTTLFQIRNS